MAFYFQDPMAQIYFHRSDSNILWLRGRIGFHHIGFYRTKSVWGWGNLVGDMFNKRTRNWKLLTIGLGYINFPWLQQCSTFSWNSPVHQNQVSFLDFSSLYLFTQFNSGIHSESEPTLKLHSGRLSLPSRKIDAL